MDKHLNKEKMKNDRVYVVKNRLIKEIGAPTSRFGKTTISLEDGKPTRVEYN